MISEYVQVSGVSYPNVMKNVAGKEFGFELIIIVPKDCVRERMSQKRATGSGVCDKSLVAVMPMQCRRFYRCTGGEGIENGYKCKAIRPRTTGTNRSVRIFMFFMSLFICNLGVFFRTNNEHIDLQTCCVDGYYNTQ